MILNHRYIFVALFVIMMVSLAGCSHQDEPQYPDQNGAVTDDKSVILRLSISTDGISGSRAGAPDYFEAPSGEFEKIYTIRVILVKNGNEIEANKLVRTTESGHPIDDRLEFKVATGSKRVYLIANEASLPVPAEFAGTGAGKFTSIAAFLDGVYKVGSSFSPVVFREWLVSLPGGNPSATAGLYSNIPNANGLPLTEFFDFNIGADFTDTAYDETQTVHLFLTRAAAKATFNIEVDDNYKGSGVDITGIRINGLNWQQYVFPRNTEYIPAKVAEITPGLTGDYTPEKERYIVDFATPARVNNVIGANVTLTLAEAIALKAGTNTSVGPVYLPESLMPETMASNPAARFSVQIQLDGNDTWLDARQLGIEPDNIQFIDGAQAISRNTHLKITIHFGEAGIVCKVAVVPYIGVTLDPIFGTF